MKYYKQWTQFETQMSVVGNLRKVYGQRYHLRCDYGQIFIWTKDDVPKLLLIVFVEASFTASQQACQELAPQESVRRFRVCGSSLSVADDFKDIL